MATANEKTIAAFFMTAEIETAELVLNMCTGILEGRREAKPKAKKEKKGIGDNVKTAIAAGQ